ncbi:hypothetical protein FRB99_001120 [Tulasnella sp. 403]|nr:hypothetical protein FRB99_001120 [Tulasnella sp. 403]
MITHKRPQPPHRRHTNPPGLLPSKRISNVKPVQEYNSISELRLLRAKTLHHLQPSCPIEVRRKVQERVAEIDNRIQQLSSLTAVTEKVQQLNVEDRFSYGGEAGPSNPRPSGPSRRSTISSSNGGGASPESRLSMDIAMQGAAGQISSSPTSPIFPLSSKARIISQPLITPAAKHRSNHRVQPMSLEETIKREQVEYEKAVAHREKVEARRAQREAMALPSPATARAAGLSEEEMRARILAFMNFKGDSDDEEDEDEEDEDYDMDQDSGDFETRSDRDDQMSDEDPVYMDMLSDIIKVDTSRPPSSNSHLR